MLPPCRSNACEWQGHMLVILLLDVGTELYAIPYLSFFCPLGHLPAR